MLMRFHGAAVNNAAQTIEGLAMRSSRQQSHHKKSSGPAGPDNREPKDPMGDTGH
ncbi:hypothetical protein T02_7606 [Trichinella nativa]|uniref:Uncharacterized protein n=1 Tax=Trichinella nativa TaxID=6335 RepID=A0A0V1KK65_9BILA|nr:hypothetical protein T02_7606 [Trichinella nativa]